jgi:hypothetical protein
MAVRSWRTKKNSIKICPASNEKVGTLQLSRFLTYNRTQDRKGLIFFLLHTFKLKFPYFEKFIAQKTIENNATVTVFISKQFTVLQNAIYLRFL